MAPAHTFRGVKNGREASKQFFTSFFSIIYKNKACQRKDKTTDVYIYKEIYYVMKTISCFKKRNCTPFMRSSLSNKTYPTTGEAPCLLAVWPGSNPLKIKWFVLIKMKRKLSRTKKKQKRENQKKSGYLKNKRDIFYILRSHSK